MNDGDVKQSPVQIPGVVVGEVRHAAPAVSAVAATSVGGSVAVEPDPFAPVDPATPPHVVPAVTPVVTPVTEPVPAAEAPVEEPAAEKKKPSTPRGSGMASGGQPVETPGLAPTAPVWPGAMNPDEMYVPEEFDVTDLMEVNREMNRARARLFRVSQTLKLVQRTYAEAQSEYDRAMRREMVSISGGTAESRRAMSEIRCEAFENRVIIGKQVVEEWKKRSTDCRDDLKAIENISHNVRAQIDIR